MSAPGPSTTRPRTAAELLDLLESSHLLAQSLLQRLLRFYDQTKLGTARELSQRLIQDQVLTHFQASSLLRGEHQFYFQGMKLLDPRKTCDEAIGFVAEDVRQQRLVQLDVWEVDRARSVVVANQLEEISQGLSKANRFLTPCRSLKLLSGQNPGIVLATDFEELLSLSNRIERRGVFTPLEAARIVGQFAELVLSASMQPLPREVTLDEMTLSEGNLRWNKTWGDVRQLLIIQEPQPTLDWPHQSVVLYCKLLGKNPANPAVMKELPQGIRKSFEQALAFGDLQSLATGLSQLGIPPLMRSDDVPAPLKRKTLTVHLRRSPDWRTVVLPEIELLTTDSKPRSRSAKKKTRPVAEAMDPTPSPQVAWRRKRRRLGSLIPVLILLIGLIVGEVVVWWQQSHKVSAQEELPVNAPQESHNPLDKNDLKP